MKEAFDSPLLVQIVAKSLDVKRYIRHREEKRANSDACDRKDEREREKRVYSHLHSANAYHVAEHPHELLQGKVREGLVKKRK